MPMIIEIALIEAELPATHPQDTNGTQSQEEELT
jgi:hypothetical protein